MPKPPSLSPLKAKLNEIKMLHDLQEHIDAQRHSSESVRRAVSGSIDLARHYETSQQVGFGLQAMGRLLDRLEEDVHVDEIDDPIEVVPGKSRDQIAEDEYAAEVLMLREWAATDTTNETMSVADYSLEPPPPESGHSPLTDIPKGVLVSLAKVYDSIDALDRLAQQHPQWWNSVYVARRVRTLLIRANYHARLIKTWSDLMRAHMFVVSSTLNTTTKDAAEDIKDLHLRAVQHERRRQELHARRDTQQKERARLEHELAELKAERDVLDGRLRRRVISKDAAIAETRLLLDHLNLLERLRGPIKEVDRWLVTYDATTGSGMDRTRAGSSVATTSFEASPGARSGNV